MSDTSSSENWVLGVTLGLLGSVAINTGNNIQSLGLQALKENKRRSTRDLSRTVPVDENGKFSAETERELEKSELGPCSSTVWVIGTCIFVSGSLLNFASYAFAAQSMLASLESIQFVTNLLFGKFMLRADVSRRMMFGTLLTVLGTVVAVQFSSKVTLTLNSAEMIELYKNPAYIVYLVLMILTMVLLNHIYENYKKKKYEGNPLPRTETIMPLSYAMWSALIGTQSVVQAKILAELLAVQSSGTENVFVSKFTYVTIVIWLITVSIWLSRLNKALSKFDPLFIIPLLQCGFIFFTIVSGGIFFREFDTFSFQQWIGFWSGVFIMFIGLRLLTPIKSKKFQNHVVPMNDPQEDIRSSGKPEFDPSSPRGEGDLSTLSPVSFKGCLGAEENQGESVAASSISGSYLSCQANEVASPRISPEKSVYSNSTASTSRRKRPLRQSLTLKTIESVKEIIVESAHNVVNHSSLLLTPPNRMSVLTDAMIASTEGNETDQFKLRPITDTGTVKKSLDNEVLSEC